MLRALAGLVCFAAILNAQILTGRVEGIVLSPDGQPRPGETVTVTGSTGFQLTVHADDQGRFELILPYGYYRVAGYPVQVAPMATVPMQIVPNPLLAAMPTAPGPRPGPTVPAEPFSLQGSLSILGPTVVTEPINFTGTADNRLAVVSWNGFPWTATQFRMEGLDATDSYQPGRPMMLPDTQALEATSLRSAYTLGSSTSFGSETGVYLTQSDTRWHGGLASYGTGALLASDNLPAQHDGVQQSDRYRWLTRDHAEAGGPLTHWADVFASGSGQWSSQTLPLTNSDQRGRMLYGNILGQARAGVRDRIDGLYSGSRIDLSAGGDPAGFEALAGRRMSPQFELPGGFANQAEVDHLDFVQSGWTHQFSPDSAWGATEVRYGYSTAHLDTRPSTASNPDQSRIDLVGSAISGAPPIENLAVRTRHQFEGAWQLRTLRTGGWSHALTAGGGWKTSAPRNRFTAPSNLNLITANGAPAFVVEFNTPLDSRARVNATSLYMADHIAGPGGLAADFAVVADFSRGGLPAQGFAARPDLIVWNGAAPRAGFSWSPPRGRGFTIEGAWARSLAPLAGRYLDFGNPNSLGGNEYQWIDRNGDGWFQAGEQGALLMRFGGPYSSISPYLRRPYADEVHVGASMNFAQRARASVRLFRRDEKHGLAAINTGVPDSAYTARTITDPGPDGVFGTFDDRPLTVWEQNPATFGQDRYLLTNPAGLRMQNTGVAAEASGAWRGVTLRASFLAEKSYGPTNPGDAVFENDSGVVGALFADPNTAINAANRIFVDRAFVGKLQTVYRLPAAAGGIELSSVVNYLDGLVFARQLLVTGLAQGPFLVASTVRGSPEGGNRAAYVLNWNLRMKREFRVGAGALEAAVDLMNLANAGQRIQEVDWSGPTFNLRLPVAVQAARFARLELRYDF
jgi:hypothetical protein